MTERKVEKRVVRSFVDDESRDEGDAARDDMDVDDPDPRRPRPPTIDAPRGDPRDRSPSPPDAIASTTSSRSSTKSRSSFAYSARRPSVSSQSLGFSIAAFSIGTMRDSFSPLMTKTADVLRQVPRKAAQRAGQFDQLPHDRTVGVEAILLEAGTGILAAVPPRVRRGQPIDAFAVEPECLTDVADRRARAIGDHGRGQRRAMAAVLVVDVLDDFLAPLVLEVDVDVGRLVALLRQETFEERLLQRRVDLGDTEAIADGPSWPRSHVPGTGCRRCARSARCRAP